MIRTIFFYGKFCIITTCIFFLIKEGILFDKEEFDKFRNITKNEYILNTNTKYTFIASIFDFIRYLKHDFVASEVVIFTILYFLYFIYLCTSVPITGFFNVYRTIQIIFFKLTKKKKILSKPEIKNIPIDVTPLNLFKMYYSGANADSYFIIYVLIKRKKLKSEEFIKNLTLLYTTGRPVWYLVFCIRTTRTVSDILNKEVGKRKKKRVGPVIFLKEIKKVMQRYVIEKNIAYCTILDPLIIEISSDIRINGGDTIVPIMAIKNLFKLNRFGTIIDSGSRIPHLILTDPTKTNAEVFTSSPVIGEPEKKCFIRNMKIPSKNDKQYAVRRLISADDKCEITDHILGSTGSNLNIKTAEDYMGFSIRSNMMYYNEERMLDRIDFLTQNGKKTVILQLPVDQEKIAKLMQDEELRGTFFELYGKVYSFGEKIYQEDLIKQINEANAFIEKFDNAGLVSTLAEAIRNGTIVDENGPIPGIGETFVANSEESKISFILAQSKIIDY